MATMGRETDSLGSGDAGVQRLPGVTEPFRPCPVVVLQAVHEQQAVRGQLHPDELELHDGPGVRVLPRVGRRDGREQQRGSGAMKAILALMGLVLGLSISSSCETTTMFCTDVGNTGWTCYCKADGGDCGSIGECARTCPSY